MGHALVLPFEQLRMSDRPRVGGKAASLGELTAAGLPVPGGYVVTTAAFEQALADLDPDGHIRAAVGALDSGNHAGIQACSQRLRAQVEQGRLSDALVDAVVAAYTALGSGLSDHPVAVRSSATSEDSSDASFAGMQDTFLWVRGPERVLTAVRSCWASLYSTESIAYRLRLGLDESALAMGVVVQRMVDARSAGVMFTRAPASGDRSVVAVDASWGLGSAVVSGEVTPDSYVLSKVTGEITSRTVATKHCRHRPDPAGEGVMEEDVPPDEQDRPAVSDEQLRTLLDLALRVERHYGSPQDIEWAIDESTGAAFLLQSRPETVWATKERQAVSGPRPRAFDHVAAVLGGKPKPKPSGQGPS